jgi:cysteine desulfurase
MEIYLDHAATTYTDKRVIEVKRPFFEETYGNASSLHGFGRAAEKAVMKAREQTAAAIGAKAEEIYFTSGGTECDNWAIKGIAELAGKGHIITTSIEHHAVLDTCDYLKSRGFDVTFLPVDETGRVSAKDVEEAIQPDTILISVMFANNETGVLMPIAEIGKIARENDILFHTDAVQAVGHVPIDVNALDIDLLSISAHKFYGPKGIGALYVRQGVTIGRFMHGGAQERNVRAGTLNTPGIVGLGAAAQLAADTMEENARHERMLANRLAEGLLTLPETKLNGGDAERLPGHVNVTFGGIEAEALMTFLDLEGIAVSTGSACSSGSLKPSYVLRAMGLSIEDARGSLRMSIGRDNNVQQIDMAIQTTKAAVERLQALSPLFAQRQGGKKHV